MVLQFAKWQGTGNDFILVDDRQGVFPSGDEALVRRLCDRHFGIGSDGLILLQAPREAGHAYHMEFFNPDGSRSFCGNGSRCAYGFWCALTGDRSPVRFAAIDGAHTAAWLDGLVRIGMRDVAGVERVDARTDRAHTGSPHLLVWVDDPDEVDLVPQARAIRYNAEHAAAGINVNFLRWANGRVEMRTYERGVEAETLSCGTGVTAAALAAMARGHAGTSCAVSTKGGELRVDAVPDGRGGYVQVHLSGPVAHVFTGQFEP
ncbi:MAG: diaminopimelate epimerase [Flavobacteriales bacterium]|nr:diaminopimelate epimerase [Flavobacteriales bacterium]